MGTQQGKCRFAPAKGARKDSMGQFKFARGHVEDEATCVPMEKVEESGSCGLVVGIAGGGSAECAQD